MTIFKKWIVIGLWHQIFAGISASMGAFASTLVYGWVTPILPYLLSADSEIQMTSEESSWVISLPLVASLISPILSAFLANRIGRKPVILLIAPIFAIGWVFIVIYKTYTVLLVARLFQNIGVGLAFSIIPVYLGEIACPELRGAITSLFYIFNWIGFLACYCTGPFMSFTAYLFFNFVGSLLFFPLILMQPESPYFYLMKNKRPKAKKSLMWFRSTTDAGLEQELESLARTVKEKELQKTSWKEIVATKADRKALWLYIFVNLVGVFCGTNQVVLYASEIFQSSSSLVIAPEIITITLGTILVLGSICSFFIVDALGRRHVFISSCAISAVCLFVVSIFYYLTLETSVDLSSFNLLPAFVILVFAAVSVAGIFPVSCAFIELFTSNTRSKSSAITTILQMSLAFVCIKLYQTFVDVVGLYFNFVLFGAACLVGSVVSYFYLPETKNKTFEEIRKEL